jgi:hypothetical protein
MDWNLASSQIVVEFLSSLHISLPVGLGIRWVLWLRLFCSGCYKVYLRKKVY